MFFTEMCDTAHDIKAGLNAIQSIHLAMVESGVDPSNWVNGLYYVSSKLEDDVNKLENLLDNEEKKHNTGRRVEP